MPDRPQWVLAPHFDKAWTYADALLDRQFIHNVEYPDYAEAAWEAAPGEGKQMLAELESAHVMVISADQLNVLPVPDGFVTPSPTGPTRLRVNSAAVANELAALRLPFPDVFVDCGCAQVAGFPIAVGGVYFGTHHDGTCFARPSLTFEGKQVTTWAAYFMLDGDLIDCYATTAGSAPGLDRFGDMDAYATAGIERGLAALRFLEAVNVEAVPAPTTRQIRRQAERSGARIPLVIQPKSRQRSTASRTGTAIDYSHRFEVRGHYKHVTKGPTFNATDPADLCYVPGKGLGRRIWVPPHIKGPDDRPLVLKTRRIG